MFFFSTIKMCPTPEECARILGVHYDTDSIVYAQLNIVFKLQTSKTLRIKNSILGTKAGNSC